jgi:uncharacterized delta-60 repeat protein
MHGSATTPPTPPSPRRRRRTASPLLPAAAVAAGLLAPPVSAQVGAPDPTFGGDGVVTYDLDDADLATAVAARLDGTLLVVGSTQGATASSRDALVLRYAADGSLLASLQYFEQPFGCNAPESLYAVAPEADGRLVVGGYAQFGCSGMHERDFWLLRLEADGSGGARFDRPVFFGSYDDARGLAIQPDGRIVAVGVAGIGVTTGTYDFALARYHPDRTIDTAGFGTNGEVTVDFAGAYDSATGVALQADGKIVAAGFATVAGQRDIALARLLPSGTLDPTFGSGGRVTTDLDGFDDSAAAVAVLADGAIVVAGSSIAGDGVRDAVVLRYLSDGSLDPTFGSGGIATLDFGLRPAAVYRVLVQYDDKLVVAGSAQDGADATTGELAVARLLPDGDPDPSFDGDGSRTVDAVAGHGEIAVGLALQPIDGHLVAAGYSIESSGGDTLHDVALTRLVGDAGLLIFTDGFESGDTSRWSA